jgi:hypothetical protein
MECIVGYGTEPPVSQEGIGPMAKCDDNVVAVTVPIFLDERERQPLFGNNLLQSEDDKLWGIDTTNRFCTWANNSITRILHIWNGEDDWHTYRTL